MEGEGGGGGGVERGVQKKSCKYMHHFPFYFVEFLFLFFFFFFCFFFLFFFFVFSHKDFVALLLDKKAIFLAPYKFY